MVLSTMREKTKIVMLVLAVAFVGWLVFDVGMGVTGQRTGGRDVGSVNGHPISVEQWNEAYRVAYESNRAQNPGVVMSRDDERDLENQTWGDLVDAELLREEYARHGIAVTDREIADAVRAYPPQQIQQAPDFQTNGRFDPAKYARFLASNNEQTREFLLAMEARWRQDLPRFKLLQEVTSDIFVPDDQLWQIWRDSHDSVWVRLLVIRPDQAVADASVHVTDEDLTAYYNAHKTDFQRPARARVSFVGLIKLPSPYDSAQVMAKAQALRDSIVHGASFEDIARSESADSATRDSGGMLGTFAKGRAEPGFDQAVWRTPVGQVSEPTPTGSGVHLIKVERRTADSARARQILLHWGRIGARLDTLEARADSLDKYAAEQNDPAALDSIAKWMGLPIQRGPLVPQVVQGVPYVLGRYRIPDIGVWAFDARPGETSPVIETEGAYYVFRLDSTYAAGVPPLAEIKNQVRAAVVERKKHDAALQIARDAERRLNSGQTMDQVAADMHLTTLPIGPFTRVSNVAILGQATGAIGTAFRLRVGERSGLLDNNGALFFMQVDKIARADSAAWRAQMDQQRGQITSAARQARVQQYMDGLRRAARIKDNRAEVLRPAARDTTRG